MKNFIKKYYKPLIYSIIVILYFEIYAIFLKPSWLKYLLYLILPMLWGWFYFSIGAGLGCLFGGLNLMYVLKQHPHYSPNGTVTFLIIIAGFFLGAVLQIAIPLIVKSHKKRKLKRQEQNLVE